MNQAKNKGQEESSTITVIKLDVSGQETWRYQGKVLMRDEESILLEAFFDREDRLFHGMPLRTGDRFVETYYTGRWYNIFEIHGRGDDRLRGWYCNIAKPAMIWWDTLSYVDLALDLLVFPDGRQVVLDEEEFSALRLSESEHQRALAALAELQARFASSSKGLRLMDNG